MQAKNKEKTQGAGVRAANIVEHPASRAYRLDGTPAQENTRGIVIENQQKVVRK